MKILKRIIKCVLSLAVLLVIFMSWKAIQLSRIEYKEPSFLANKKILTIYYSHGKNIESVAENIHKIVGGDIKTIEPLEKYPDSFIDTFKTVQKQIKDNYLPKVETIDLTEYDVIFVGSPVWATSVSLPVKSFLINNNFDNKLVLPFFSYLGDANKDSLKSQVEKSLKEKSSSAKVLTPMLTIKKGIILIDKQIEGWLNSLSESEQ